MTSPAKTTHREIDAQRDGERPFVVRPKDNDLFVQTGNQLIAASRLGISLKLWLTELDELCERVADWAAGRSDLVVAVYAAPRGNRIVFFIATGSGQYNFALGEEITQLQQDAIQGFKIGFVEFFQIPNSEVDQFVAPGESMRVYGSESH